jgi:hypothetical protein
MYNSSETSCIKNSTFNEPKNYLVITVFCCALEIKVLSVETHSTLPSRSRLLFLCSILCSQLMVPGGNTRNRNQFHLPSSSISCFQKGVFYLGIRIFNSLPDNVISLRYDRMQFRKEPRKYFITHSFYSQTEFFELNK